MGIVRSIQKGEQPASKFSKDAQDTAKKMKKSSVKKYAKTKHDDLPTKKESTASYKKTLQKIARDKQLKMISKKDKEILMKISKMMKEGTYKSATKNELAQYIINLNNMLAVAKSKKMTNHIKFIQQDIKDVKKALSKKKNESVNEAERDYKDEYKKFQSSTKSKKYRAELNKYNRDKGTYGNGDGKDASHKGGKIVGFEKESKNRGRAEKSRLKKENNMPDFNPIIDEVLDEVFGEYQMNESSKVLKSIENLAKQNKYGNVTGTKMNGKTANLIMKIYNHPKMKKYQKAMEKYTSDELVDMTLKMPKVLGIKEDVNEVNMAHVYSKDLNKKKFKDLGLYLSNVLDLAPNKDFRLTTNKKLLAINIDKINPKSLQNIKKRFGIDLKQKAKEPIRLKSKSGMGKISHLGMESVNESISAFDVDFYKDTNNRQTSHEEIVKGDKFSDVISKTTKVAKSKKMNYAELYYKGAFIGSINKRNGFEFRKGRNHQKSPLSVNEGQKKQASMILRKFDMAFIKFSREIRDVIKLVDRSTGSKVDGKIIEKAYEKGLIPLNKIMIEWDRGQQENPGLSEDETLEGLGDKFGKKLDKYNKKNKKSKDALKKYAKLKKK